MRKIYPILRTAAVAIFSKSQTRSWPRTALPFSDVLTSERIEQAFARHGGLFGQHGVYSTPIVLWAFLSQVLRDGKEAACQSAVAEITNYCLHVGIQPPTEDTGDYCRARAKLSEAALHELGKEVADELQQRADESWLWKGRHAKLVDGFTFTMPDTPKNLAEFPHPRTQKKGVGLPIARVVAILSLATACVMDAAIGPYKGKETGESALLRSMLSSLHSGDVAVFDRYYCSFLMIALLQLQGTDVCARLHQKRKSDFRTGKRLGKGDHLIVWTKPAKPDWMDQETYDRIPETLELRELRYTVVEKGRRTKTHHGGHHLDGRRALQPCRDRGTLRFSLELGTGHPGDQVVSQSRTRPLQIAGDGPPGTADHAAGLQPDSDDRGQCGRLARQATTPDQFYGNVSVRLVLVAVDLLRSVDGRSIRRTLPRPPRTDCQMRSRQPPRPP